jgi:hypothetical protein
MPSPESTRSLTPRPPHVRRSIWSGQLLAPAVGMRLGGTEAVADLPGVAPRNALETLAGEDATTVVQPPQPPPPAEADTSRRKWKRVGGGGGARGGANGSHRVGDGVEIPSIEGM